MMEKALFVHIFTIVTFMLCNNSFPQDSPIGKGSKIISGNFSFSSAGGELNENNNGDRLFTIEFDPAVNFFISPGLLIFLY